MIKLQLSRGGYTLIDDEDYEKIYGHSWFLAKVGYAVSTTNNPRGTLYLHRLIMDASSGLEVDHINGDKLDNRKINLRLVSRQKNMWNVHKVRSKSGHKGVYWSKQNKKWNAQIGIDGRSTSLGFFDNINDAIKRRKEVERQLLNA